MASNSSSSTLDFARCKRPDGSVYGSRGKCRQGVEIGAEEAPAKSKGVGAAALSKTEKVALRVMADKSFRSDRSRIAEMVRLGVPADTDFVALVSAAKKKIGLSSTDTVRGSLRKAKAAPKKPGESLAERMAAAYDRLQSPASVQSKGVSTREPEVVKFSRDKRKEMVRGQLEKLKEDRRLRSLRDVNRNVKGVLEQIQEDPSKDTTKNRIALTALRALRAQMAKEEKSKRKGGREGVPKVKPELSPEYVKTPGSRKPLAPDFFAKSPLLLGAIYQAQGFNAKPELVRSRSELEKRDDILREPDGRALVLYRGVTLEKHVKQFQGTGPKGDIHFAGKGIFGNGTYAASAGRRVKESKAVTADNLDGVAQKTASIYTGEMKGSPKVEKKVMALALRADANVVQFEGPKSRSKYYEWRDEIMRQAGERFGRTFNDCGEAAAAMGVHAYRIPYSRVEDYWVILNRGAVIAAQKPQLNLN